MMLRAAQLQSLVRSRLGPTLATRTVSHYDRQDMPRWMTVTFLGTNSGGGPTDLRNCSSLVAEVAGDGSLWMVDCAEGTLRQFALQPSSGTRLSIQRLNKIFITHMHVDHVMGIVPLLRNLLRPPRKGVPTSAMPSVEVYGPAGLRTFVRSIMTMTHTCTLDRYVVHELLSETDPVTPCEPPEVLHPSETAGRDIRPDHTGFWRAITATQHTRRSNAVEVDASPIVHRVPTIGYVIRETLPPSRKLVFLGDTSDASPILPLCVSPSPTLLVHEATDTVLPTRVDPRSRRIESEVLAKVIERGHSTPGMAGAFARKVQAETLLLNHISARFPPESRTARNRDRMRTSVIEEIERQASEAWGMGQASVATDYMRIFIPVRSDKEDGHEEHQDD